jgi:hypothetical protein
MTEMYGRGHPVRALYFCKKALVGDGLWFTGDVALARVETASVQDSSQGRGDCSGGYGEGAE